MPSMLAVHTACAVRVVVTARNTAPIRVASPPSHIPPEASFSFLRRKGPRMPGRYPSGPPRANDVAMTGRAGNLPEAGADPRIPRPQRRVVAHDRVVAHRARRDEAEWHADQLFQALQVLPRLGG